MRSAPPTRPVICASVAPWFPPYEGGFRGRLVRLDLTLLVRPLISEALSNDAIAFAVLEPQQLQAAMAQDQTRVVRRRVFDYVAVAGPCCSG